ncbi:sirohydrochlorin chelatase [Cellulosimicrobium marinum]|uniref:sirohydrochlorin chelatase n=1 Tax=Cellulosimicrobium marinum TaxID=1638992 RepID=UPI001E2D07CC|nr:CbiX/SirB N-terminal domain-containing protein [Cellulosimicrobium marinum]MCB7134972.1 sirohydrochlorin chelatase [Cellulosimicrobium marinum]
MSTEILAFPSGTPAARTAPGAGGGAAGSAGAPPVLVGCSHGTNDPTGRAVIRALLDDVRAARPDLDVREAFVDVQQPEVADVVTSVVAPGAGSASGGVVPGDVVPGDAVVVPLLLSGGFHVGVDIAESVADRGPGAGRAAAAAPLGPDDRLADLLADRLAEAGLRPGDAVVIAAAGSSRPGAARDVEQLATALRERVPNDVSVGYGAMAKPSVPDAVAAARTSLTDASGEAGAPGERAASGTAGEGGPRVVVAAYLLAPGYFYDRVLEAGADVVTAPLAPDPRLTSIVLDRYADAAATLAPAP